MNKRKKGLQRIYSRVSNKRVYTRICILAKFPLYMALLDTYTTPCKSKTWWAKFFDKQKKLKLLHKNDAQDIERDQNEHKSYEYHNSYAHWTWCLKVAMLVMYREFSKNPLYTLIRYLHDGCPILDFHHTRLIDHTRLLDTQEYYSSMISVFAH